MTRRGKVLGLMRAKIAMGRDIESLLKYRGELADKIKTGKIDVDDSSDEGDAKSEPAAINGGDANATEGKTKGAEKAVDLVQVWNNINTQLKQAEMACNEIETPAVMSQMVISSDKASNGNRSRSPVRSDSDSGRNRKRSNSVTSEAESTSAKKKSPIPPGLEPHVIPWDCMVEPQTPYEVPLLLSCLSSATDRAVGYCKFVSNILIIFCLVLV